MKRLIAMVMVAGCLSVSAYAQTPVAPDALKTVTPDDSKAVKTPATAVPAPQISPEASKALADIQSKIGALEFAKAVLQKEDNAARTELSDLVQQLQRQCAATPGYELGPQVTCVKKPDPPKAPGKKDDKG